MRSEKQMVTMQKRRCSYETICAVTLSFVAITGSAFAYDLSDKDYEYLKTQHVERDHAPLSPKERSRLHGLINDPQTANDTAARDKNVKDFVAVFLDHQLWEKRIQANYGMRRRVFLDLDLIDRRRLMCGCRRVLRHDAPLGSD